MTSVVLRPRSLLFFSDEAYTSHLHGIDQVWATSSHSCRSFAPVRRGAMSVVHCLPGAHQLVCSQASIDIVDDTVCNANTFGLQHGDELLRQGERVSLTVRRVERVMPRLLRL